MDEQVKKIVQADVKNLDPKALADDVDRVNAERNSIAASIRQLNRTGDKVGALVDFDYDFGIVQDMPQIKRDNPIL